MTAHGKLAFIGAGQMAGALIKGLISAGTWRPEAITASDVSAERLKELQETHGITTVASNAEAVVGASIVVLSTKPQVLYRVLADIAKRLDPTSLVVSIAAGVPTALIESQLSKGARVVRVMPNTPALIGQGATAIAAGAHASADDIALAEGLFKSVGTTVTLPENLIDAVTGVSGSGPAYVFMFIEALADAGVNVGLPRAAALELAVQTVAGSARLVQESKEHPARLKDMVTSPAGTTIAGVHSLERSGLRAAIMDAVQAASQRAKALGELLSSKSTPGRS